MPKKKLASIGTNVLKRGMPSKVELILKSPSPLDIIQLKLQWEKEEKRAMSEEEFQRRLQEHIELRKRMPRKKRRHTPKFAEQAKYI